MLIYTLPFIAAIIGWVTNYLAIKMLFHPREKINLIFFSLQGIFPKRQKGLYRSKIKICSSDAGDVSK